MLNLEHQRLIESYLAARTWVTGADGVLRRVDESDWASGALFDVVWEDAPLGWELICEISRRTDSTEILEELANGPLHQLLADHPQTIDTIEAQAVSEASIRALLSRFYDDNPLPDGLIARVQRAREPQH